jgi:uncharacterized protein (TIGR00251 family)
MIIKITVVANAKTALVTKIAENEYRVKVDAPPSNGRANERLIEIIASYFDVPKSKISIKAGHKSKHKVLQVG